MPGFETIVREQQPSRFNILLYRRLLVKRLRRRQHVRDHHRPWRRDEEASLTGRHRVRRNCDGIGDPVISQKPLHPIWRARPRR